MFNQNSPVAEEWFSPARGVGGPSRPPMFNQNSPVAEEWFSPARGVVPVEASINF
jgi:hypothetical protein